MNKKKVIAICGKSGSGKDTILKKIVENKDMFFPIVSYTTRPKREHEVDGVDYHFITKEELVKKIYHNEMLEVSDFNNWFYGSSFDSLDDNKINVGVYNPTGIDALNENSDRIEMIVFYIDVDSKERMLRSLNRETEPDINEIIRRYKTDEEDFANFTGYDVKLINKNPTDLDWCVDFIIKESLKFFDNK